MHQPPFEVADVIRTLATADDRVPGLRVSQAGQRVLRDLAACRTAKLGGHVDACDACGEVRVSYNSCRNRHCPKCQAQQRAIWLEKRCQDLLPVPCFHLVFTLPAELAPLALQNQRELYGALFAATAATLKTIAADPNHLGADIGFIAVLHTWGQTLVHHPHLHCVIPGGGLSPDGADWISCRNGFFLPVRVLSHLFRGKMLAALKQRFAADRLQSTVPWPSWLIPLASAHSASNCAPSSGWCMPSLPSAAPSRCSSISPATPIASPSPTAESPQLTQPARRSTDGNSTGVVAVREAEHGWRV